MVAFEEGEEPQNASIVEIGKTTVTKCGGLPPAIRAIGSIYMLCEKGSFVSCELKELRELNNLRGQLEISNLRPGKEAAKGAESANLKAKQYLQSLILRWNSNVDTDASETTIGHEKSLEALQPQPNLQALSLDFYGGIKFSKLAPHL
ncbi:hypothetical protein L484_024426 [Morus notabilis]|uniref:R13L1/DRL21-like LRR repeat region domain-containing protein n=1 Tax=Morus notabilis TaxID=981085 RepID=W9SLM1_9ROSA|nr:hypothetical protein L484_024426 [Morus notabilis]